MSEAISNELRALRESIHELSHEIHVLRAQLPCKRASKHVQHLIEEGLAAETSRQRISWTALKHESQTNEH